MATHRVAANPDGIRGVHDKTGAAALAGRSRKILTVIKETSVEEGSIEVLEGSVRITDDIGVPTRTAAYSGAGCRERHACSKLLLVGGRELIYGARAVQGYAVGQHRGHHQTTKVDVTSTVLRISFS